MALKKPIEVRPMTLEEYDMFSKASKEIANDPAYEGLTGLIGNAIGKWIFANIYPKVDINKLTPGTVAAVTNRTLDATNMVEEADIKNYEPSGSGELRVDLDSVKLADKPQK